VHEIGKYQQIIEDLIKILYPGSEVHADISNFQISFSKPFSFPVPSPFAKRASFPHLPKAKTFYTVCELCSGKKNTGPEELENMDEIRRETNAAKNLYCELLWANGLKRDCIHTREATV